MLLLILLTDEEPLLPSQPLGEAVDEDGPPTVEAEVGCPRDKQKKFRFKPKQPKQTASKQREQTETNRNNPNFCEKIPKYALYQTVSVALLFVSVQNRNNRNKRFVSDSAETSFGSRFGCFESKLVSKDTLGRGRGGRGWFCRTAAAAGPGVQEVCGCIPARALQPLQGG
jgi:hypothetical protein